MTAAGQEQDYNRVSHPVDLMEHIACLQDWVFERSSEDELTVSVAGSWCDYHISFNLRDDLESVLMARSRPRSNARRCSRPRSTLANGIIRLSSLLSGPANAPRTRWRAPFSRLRVRLERKQR